MNKLKQSLAAKICAAVVLIIMLWTLLCCLVLCVGLTELDAYASPSGARYRLLESRAYDDATQLVNELAYSAYESVVSVEHIDDTIAPKPSDTSDTSDTADTSETADTSAAPDTSAASEVPESSGTTPALSRETLLRLSESNLSFRIVCDDRVLFDNLPASAPLSPDSCRFEMGFSRMPNNRQQSYVVTAILDPTLPHKDVYRLFSRVFDIAYALRYAVYFIAFAALAVCALLGVFLLASAGHRRGTDEIGGPLAKLPPDLSGAFLILATLLFCYMLSIVPASSLRYLIIVLFGFANVLAAALIVYIMSLAVLIKQRRLLRATLIFIVFSAAWRALRAAFGAISKAIPAVPRAVIVCAALWGWLVLISFIGPIETRVWLMLISATLLAALAIYCAYTLHRLRCATKRLADGELDTPISTSGMKGDMLRIGEDLRGISNGMSHAVEERMRSERFKTELITNVSHDIKTPLTSIINYSDLISREPCDNQNIRLYAVELTRQSERLKNLIVDLVEASKASTGNIELDMQPCEIGVLVTQAAGEYQTRLEQNNLTLVCELAAEGVQIVADGPRLWRVLDNLMGNALKYSQPGTRVYLKLSESGGRVLITLRNTSKNQLNIPAEELMERFVRGDSSRHTEGNGLGLSIARSLTELMGGELRLDIDGDLFKVTLDFPRCNLS